jgi:hypothetical protein
VRRRRTEDNSVGGRTGRHFTNADSSSAVKVAPRQDDHVRVTFTPGNVWRVGLVLLGVVAFGLFLRFILDDGGSVLFTVLMSWFAAISMAPVVDRLARRMKRGVATIVVMVAFVVFVVLIVVASERCWSTSSAS